jgi:lipid-binding SYLF domain-containing protein
MRSPTEYHFLADEYFREAERITAKRRVNLLEMANSCRQLADQGELRDRAVEAAGKKARTTAIKTFMIVIFAALVLLGGRGISEAGSANQINAEVNATLDRLFRHIPGSHELAARAAGVLVFPTVLKAGIGIGGEYGEGALRIGGRTAGYFNTVTASFGFQLGAQARSVIILFMTPQALEAFRRIDGWKIGVDGSVAIITAGAGGSIDTNEITSPVVGFITDPAGLMYNLTLEGSKISRIDR